MIYSQVDLLACPPVKLVYTSLNGIVIDPKLMSRKNINNSTKPSTRNRIIFRFEFINDLNLV